MYVTSIETFLLFGDYIQYVFVFVIILILI